jgi:glycosyltransferase involved in cell wall biosynthesis
MVAHVKRQQPLVSFNKYNFKMKILQANKFFFQNGGSEVVMFQERDYLLNSGHEVVDFSMQDKNNLASDFSNHFVSSQNYLAITGILRKLQAALKLIHSPEAVRRISCLIKQSKPDLVHCHNIYHQLTPSIIGAAKKLGVPVVLTLHDYKPVCPVYNRIHDGQPCSDCLDGSYFNVLKHRCADGSLGKSALLYTEAVFQRYLGSYEKVDAFIAPSRFMQRSVAHRFPIERIRLLYNGVDIDTVRGSGADEGYVLYLGRISQEKGIETLLKAYASSTANWRLVVAGTGPLSDELMTKYDSRHFVGHITGKALSEMIDRASVVVVPSNWYENCPMSVLEAMAYGKPVVASCMGGIPELVEQNKTGLLFDAGNTNELTTALEKLMASPELRKQMGTDARKRVEEQFSLAQHNAGLLEIYQSVCR